MDHSLTNSNQMQMTGMLVSDEQFDYNRKLGIAHKRVSIPFKTGVTKIYFDSIVPTQCEITECAHVIMTGEM